MDGIYIEDRIYLIQRSILPVFDLRQDFICNVWNKAFWCFKTVDIFDGFGYLPGRHSFCIHGNNLLIDIRNILLTFLYNLWLKCWFTVLWNIDIHAAIAAVYTLWFISIAIIIAIRSFRFLVTKMIIHFCFHHLFDGAAKQILKRILDIFSGFNIILLKKLLNDVSLSFCHYYFVYRFLFSSCHNKRPPMIYILP